MRRSRLTVWIILLLALYALSALFAAPPSQQTTLPAGTSYSAAQTGTLALFQLLAQKPAAGAVHLQLEPEALAKWSATPKNLLIVEPQVDNSARTDRWWLRLARQGRRVIELTDQNTPLVAALGLTWHNAGASATTVRNGQPAASQRPLPTTRLRQTANAGGPTVRLAYAPGGGSPQTAGGAEWRVRGLAQAPSLTGWKPSDGRWLLARTGQQWSVVGVTRRLGSGSVTVLTIPSIAYNRTIARGDNLGALLFLLKPWLYSTGFAETVHGFALVPGILPLLGPGAAAAMVMLAAAVLLYIWSRGRRLGAVTEPEAPPVPASHAFAAALARHYRRRSDYRELLDNLNHLTARRAAGTRLTAVPGAPPQTQAGASPPPQTPRTRVSASPPPAPVRARAYLHTAREAVARLLDQTAHGPDDPWSQVDKRTEQDD